jgi:hypothetical protein
METISQILHILTFVIVPGKLKLYGSVMFADLYIYEQRLLSQDKTCVAIMCVPCSSVIYSGVGVSGYPSYSMCELKFFK